MSALPLRMCAVVELLALPVVQDAEVVEGAAEVAAVVAQEAVVAGAGECSAWPAASRRGVICAPSKCKPATSPGRSSRRFLTPTMEERCLPLAAWFSIA